jgi:hypothetical protein
MQENQTLSTDRTKHRTTSGQKSAEEDARTDTDRTIYKSCPVRSMSEAIHALDVVAFEMEKTWGENMLDHVSKEWRDKFEYQRQRLNDLIDANDDEDAISTAAQSMMRGWRKIDALIRETGVRPAMESVWIVTHPKGGDLAIYNSSASIAHLPDDIPRFHVKEIAGFIPESVYRIKSMWIDSKITAIREKKELNDEIPF